MTIKTPIFDNEESLDEVVGWVSEPLDIKERAERLHEAMDRSPSFHIYINQLFKPSLKFDVTLAQGPFVVRTRNLGRWGYTPTVNFMREMSRYSDTSAILPVYRLNQMMAALDDVYGPDSVHIVAMLKGGNILGDKINHKVLELAGFDLGEAPN